MTEKHLKAYQVSNGEYSQIVFSSTRGGAKYISEFYDGSNFLDLEVRRARWADEFVDAHSIPKQSYLDNGWWWECRCGQPQYKETAIVINELVYCQKCLKKSEGK
ncbi:hypothetical protein [Aneurinibacillus migulanus]|uniref:Uncharacterized protein n=1 Tax=Aneurinibacillus migulanus TaxID=47500 RepID=A0A0D1XTH0_ANEMI|nr:hypothetical protein [Aneurinibacillus migulanus]KIV57521.1 hypothetical protein TS65_09880 [Aneurinibacillus migulanus]KON94863.1 hypothetical protein AF333_04545 [Aneurinibacillus migulanus]MED0892875.1 hypothetical protein [Aneurinibacillus migulanus]MED1619121.1 hypothetical protein [Aneurinibacillus migulanus]SDI91867.1 hypothetical protein SAMN04487909_10989 [Aneurinibacillus migulanus]